LSISPVSSSSIDPSSTQGANACDSDAAQQAASSRRSHGHHHRHAKTSAPQQSSATPPAPASPIEPNAPGANLDVTV